MLHCSHLAQVTVWGGMLSLNCQALLKKHEVTGLRCFDLKSPQHVFFHISLVVIRAGYQTLTP